MKDNRNEMIPAQFVDWTWDLTGYVAKVPFYIRAKAFLRTSC